MLDYIKRMLPPSFGKTEPDSNQGKELNALSNVFAKIEDAIEDLKLQLFAAKATWALSLWEKELGLPTDLEAPLELRRGRVMAKLIPPLITPERFRSVLNNYGDNAVLEEFFSEYLIRAWVQNPTVTGIDSVLDTIEGLIPAHIAYEFGFEYTDNQLNVVTRVVHGIMQEFYRCNRLKSGQYWNEGQIRATKTGMQTASPIYLQSFVMAGQIRSGPHYDRTNEGCIEGLATGFEPMAAVLEKPFRRCGTVNCGEVAI